MKRKVEYYLIAFMARNSMGLFDMGLVRETDVAFTDEETALALVKKLNERSENKKFFVRPVFLKLYETEQDQDRDSDSLDYRF